MSIKAKKRMLLGKNYKGFTLAEILVVVGVIGIVTMTALPPLIEDVNERVWAARSQDTLAKFSEATNQMKVEDMLSGFANTDRFVDELQKYIKTTKRCNSSDLDKCFTPRFKLGEDHIETKTLKEIHNLWRTSSDRNNNTVALVMLDGTPMVIAFDQACERLDPFSNTPRGINGISATLGCLHMLYDTNGSAKPNAVGKDIKDYQVALTNGMACTQVPNGGPCVAKTDVAIRPVNTCDSNLVLDNGKKSGDYDNSGLSNPKCASNQWAGAKKSCENAGMKLPTALELAQMATDLYGTSIDATGNKTATMDADKATHYGIMSYGGYFWSSEQSDLGSGYCRLVRQASTHYVSTLKDYTVPFARCVAK